MYRERDPGGKMASKNEERSAATLDGWYDAGQPGPKPAGRLRRLDAPRLGAVTRTLARVPYLLMHDPDGRPRSLRRRDDF